jgi:tetratricopeptide (TPR) repeat protein
MGRDTSSGQLAAIYVAGREGFYDESITAARGVNACRDEQVPYPQRSAEGIIRLNPDVIVDLVSHINPNERTPDRVKEPWSRLRRFGRSLDRTDEAADNYRELLRLNPGDNQGVRYLLLPLLIEQDADEEVSDLLEQYDEDPAAVWLYGRALLVYREEGDAPAARRLLEEAMDANPFVPEYLLDEEEPPGWPDSYAHGSEEEALVYRDACRGAWEMTPGALDWLEQTSEGEEE